MLTETHPTTIERLRECAKERILVLDGGMGTAIQSYGLGEEDFRGDRFADWSKDLKGNNDLLNLTRPDVIGEIHEGWLEAGADIIETNTFNSTTISQSDYGTEDFVDDINLAGARLARQAADDWNKKTPKKPRFVAGAIGPTNKTLSVSPDVNKPGFREVSFDQMKAAYRVQAEALIDGGIDLMIIETIFDTLNAKAAVVAVKELEEDRAIEIPLIIAGTVTDLSGRNLSGQTVEAFWYSLRHAKPFAIGLNCSFGAKELHPHVSALARIAGTHVVAYPNAGLPNEMGEYDQPPEETARYLEDWARAGMVNLVGGCCGTTKHHIRAIAEAVEGIKPREIVTEQPAMRLSGLEAVML